MRYAGLAPWQRPRMRAIWMRVGSHSKRNQSSSVMGGKPKEVFTQVFNNAFPAGNIGVEDAVKQMTAAY